MATYSTNYNLAKPDAGDTDWAGEINGNFDTIDAEIKTNRDSITTLQGRTEVPTPAAADDGKILAYDATAGALVWAFEDDTTINGTTVPVPSADGTALTYNATAGTLEWTDLTFDPSDLELRITNLETRTTDLENERGAPGGTATLDANGVLPEAQNPKNATNIHSRPVTAPAAADDGRVLAYNSTTDAYEWVAAPSGTATETTSTGATSFWLLEELSDSLFTQENFTTGRTFSTWLRAEETHTINALRIYGYEEKEYTFHVWDVATQTMLRSVTGVFGHNDEWSEWARIDPLTLEAGKEYLISFNLETSPDYTTKYVNSLPTSALDHTLYDSRITLLGGFYASTIDTYTGTGPYNAWGPMDAGFIEEAYPTKIYDFPVEFPHGNNDGQVLVYDSATDSLVWKDNYKNEIDAVTLVKGLTPADCSTFAPSVDAVFAYEFTANETMTLNALRLLAAPARPHAIRIWKPETQELLFSATIDKTNTNDWSALDNVNFFRLEAGQNYVIGYVNLAGEARYALPAADFAGFLDSRITFVQSRYIEGDFFPTNTNTTTAYGLVDIGMDLQSAAFTDSTINGKTVTDPAATDDGKVLAYNSTADAYEWVAAPTGSTDGGGTTAAAAGQQILKVGSINPLAGDIVNDYTAGLVETEDYIFTIDEERELFIEGRLYGMGQGEDICLAISPDDGATWWRYPDTTSTAFNAPAGHQGQRIRMDNTVWSAPHIGFAYGVFPAGTYRVGVWFLSTGGTSMAGVNNMVIVSGEPTAAATASASAAKQWFEYYIPASVSTSGSVYTTKGALYAPTHDVVVHGFEFMHAQSGSVTAVVVEVDANNVQIGAPLYQGEARTTDGATTWELYELTTPITFAAGRRYIVGFTGDGTTAAASVASTSTMLNDPKTGMRGQEAARTNAASLTDGAAWEIVAGNTYYTGVKIEI